MTRFAESHSFRTDPDCPAAVAAAEKVDSEVVAAAAEVVAAVDAVAAEAAPVDAVAEISSP